MSDRGFRGREYNAVNIGKTMKRLGFESKLIRGTHKYFVEKVDYGLHTTENKEDAKEFIPEIFWSSKKVVEMVEMISMYSIK